MSAPVASAAGPLAFFAIVTVVSPLMRVCLAVTTGVALVALVLGSDLTRALVAALVMLQGCAASSGFAVPARRGHYDWLLTGSASRAAVAAAHWGMSVAPGVTCWSALAVTEALLRADRPAIVSAGGTVATLALASTLPWAISVPLPRLTGGVLWLLVAAVTAVWPAEGAGLPPPRQSALDVLVRPLEMVGNPLPQATAAAVLGIVGLGLIGAGAGVAWISRTDVRLEASQ
ncbi:MAG: hypothetical protein AB7G23_04195 [Vicinamibacterales bacterium]